MPTALSSTRSLQEHARTHTFTPPTICSGKEREREEEETDRKKKMQMKKREKKDEKEICVSVCAFSTCSQKFKAHHHTHLLNARLSVWRCYKRTATVKRRFVYRNLTDPPKCFQWRCLDTTTREAGLDWVSKKYRSNRKTPRVKGQNNDYRYWHYQESHTLSFR